MTLLLTDGCDSGLDRWSVNNSVIILSNQSQFGTGYDCFRFANNANSMFNSIRKDLIDEVRLNTINLERPDYRVSFWMKLDTSNIVANTIFLRLSNASTNVDWELAKDGRLQTWQLRQNYTSGALAANAALAMPSLADGNWHFIEIYDRRYGTSSANGQINLWVDRTSYISLASTGGFRTGSVSWNTPTYIQIGNVTGANVLIDDIVVWNDYDGGYTGNTKSNTRIYSLRPIGDDNQSNTSTSNGDVIKYNLINEANANTQTYINIGATDRFNMSDINVSSNIYGGAIITKLIMPESGYKTTIRLDCQTNKNNKINFSNTYFGTNIREIMTPIGIDTLGNTSSLMNSLKVEIKKSNTVTFVPTQYSALPISSNVVLNLDASSYFSYPGTGTTWYDLSGYNHNATLINGPSYTNTNSGEFLFNRSSLHYASITSTSTLRPTSMSIFTWVQPYSIGQEEIISQGTYRLESRLYNENARWGFSPNNGVTEYAGSVPLYNYNWYCLCITYTTSTLSFYKNGLLETSYSTPAALTYSLTAITLAQGVGVVNRYYFGKMAMYVMYDKALTASEVLQNYNASKGRFFSD